MDKIFEEYDIFLNKTLGILINVFETYESVNEKSFNFESLRMIKHNEELQKQFFESNINEISKSRKLRERANISYRSNAIYILALFERFRDNLLKNWESYSKENHEKFFKEVGRIVNRGGTENESKRAKLIDLKINKPQDIINATHQFQINTFEIERNLFGLRKLEKDIYLQKSLASFIIIRELRNLLIHRSNITDQKVFSSIRNGLGGTIFKNDKKELNQLFLEKNLDFLADFEEKEVELHPSNILSFYLDLVVISFTILKNAAGKEYDKKTQDVLGSFINDLLIITSDFSVIERFEMIKIENCIEYLSKEALSDQELESDLFIVNYIVFKIKFKEYLKSLIFNAKGENVSESKKIFNKEKKKIDEEIDKKLSLIKNKYIKNIATNFIKNDDYLLVDSIKKYFKESIKEDNLSTIANWSIIREKNKSSPLFRIFLEKEILKNKHKLWGLMEKEFGDEIYKEGNGVTQ
jgi:hypothetical protein